MTRSCETRDLSRVPFTVHHGGTQRMPNNIINRKLIWLTCIDGPDRSAETQRSIPPFWKVSYGRAKLHEKGRRSYKCTDICAKSLLLWWHSMTCRRCPFFRWRCSKVGSSWSSRIFFRYRISSFSSLSSRRRNTKGRSSVARNDRKNV